MQPEKIQLLLVGLIGTLLLLVLGALVIIFLLLFKARHRRNRLQQAEIRSTYEQAILESQLEVQNQTMQRLGEELHDNVGQLLTVIQIQLHTLEERFGRPGATSEFTPTLELVSSVVDAMRSLSRSLDGESVGNLGFPESLRLELERIQRLGKFTVQFHQTGRLSDRLSDRSTIVLFRMTQEILNNALKHSGGQQLAVLVDYGSTNLRLTIRDNGRGFTPAIFTSGEATRSSGLRNLRRRAALLGGTCIIISQPGSGTSAEINVPLGVS